MPEPKFLMLQALAVEFGINYGRAQVLLILGRLRPITRESLLHTSQKLFDRVYDWSQWIMVASECHGEILRVEVTEKIFYVDTDDHVRRPDI